MGHQRSIKSGRVAEQVDRKINDTEIEIGGQFRKFLVFCFALLFFHPLVSYTLSSHHFFDPSRQVLTELPPKTRQRIPFEVTNSEYKKKIDGTWKELSGFISEKNLTVSRIIKMAQSNQFDEEGEQEEENGGEETEKPKKKVRRSIVFVFDIGFKYDSCFPFLSVRLSVRTSVHLYVCPSVRFSVGGLV